LADQSEILELAPNAANAGEPAQPYYYGEGADLDEQAPST